MYFADTGARPEAHHMMLILIPILSEHHKI